MSRRACAAVLVVASALAGCTTTVSGTGNALDAQPRPTTTSGPGTPTFVDCADRYHLSSLPVPSDRRGELSVTCATVQVPLDYAKEAGPTIGIAVVRVHDSNNTSGRALLVNPGGPGGSGLQFALALAINVRHALISAYDIVGFDPRGVGQSSPVQCISDATKDELNAASPDIRTAPGFNQAKAAYQQIARACTTKYGPVLAQYATVPTAKDLDRLRIALGQDKLNYLGFSYGTELGAQYAHLFPDKAGNLVLDGAVDPYTDGITSFAQQLKGFEGAFDQFANWCTTNHCVANPRSVVEQLVARSATDPIPTSNTLDRRSATPSLVLTGVLSALYSKSSWPDLRDALASALIGDSNGLLALADEYNQRSNDGTYTNIADANTTISCNDSTPGPSDAAIRSTATKWASAYPMFGVWAAASLFSCQQWQPVRTPVPLPSAKATARKVLVIGNLHDPATPYKGAQDLVKAMGNAELLTWNGEGHTSYLEGSSCVDSDVNAYLINGTLPTDGTVCP